MVAKVSIYFFIAFLSVQSSFAQAIRFTIDPQKKAQVMENFGASGAWFSEGIGKYWPAEKKERMAELLFSRATDKAGNPLGIGLSAWRFNIGGGTAEQGDSSGINQKLRRVESFLSPDGSYNWNKQEGYMWFVRKAVSFGVKNLIAFSNTPPVQFTKNGLGFKLQKDYQNNLREDKYIAYAEFLATVIQHFKGEGLHFNYVSPVNEPQWDWSNKFGQMNQEGSPWHNRDIFRITAVLDSVLSSRKLPAKILLPEAATLTALYEGDGHASKQMQNFYAPDSRYYVGGLKQVHPVVAGHSYFTDSGDTTIVSVRQRLKDSAAKYKVLYWQSEYSMLGNGYKEGVKGRVSAMDCALFLSKIIHHDLTVANATAWQFWNAWEPGRADADTRYYLIALKSKALNTDGDFTVTKNLWALGHYSRFVRPGMHRLIVHRNDGLNNIGAAQEVMLSVFSEGKKMVVVAINYTTSEKKIHLNFEGVKKIKRIRQFVTTAHADENLKPSQLYSVREVTLQPRSIVTITMEAKF